MSVSYCIRKSCSETRDYVLFETTGISSSRGMLLAAESFKPERHILPVSYVTGYYNLAGLSVAARDSGICVSMVIRHSSILSLCYPLSEHLFKKGFPVVATATLARHHRASLISHAHARAHMEKWRVCIIRG